MAITLFNRYEIYPSGITYIPNGLAFTIRTTAPSTNFAIPVNGGTFNAVIDWGDGATTNMTTATTQTHTYANAGTYHIQITGTFTNTFYSSSTASDASLIISLDNLPSGMVTTLFNAWYGAVNMTSISNTFDTAGVINWNNAWVNCASLTSFPAFNTSSGTDFQSAWQGCSGVTSFPLIDTSVGTNFNSSWFGCTKLVSFPANMFDVCPATNFTSSFNNCALDQTSVDNILISIDTAGLSNGRIDIVGGTSATPSAAGLTAKNSLGAKGWTVNTN